ncbi:hypothetical protein GCM10010910_27540 [Microbacterium nanhaiense]|uniref:Glycosyltransferase family 2 protein n=1 Tax=Microbacterium nanhaiense TaxID=1301026 RepID=A0ABQ2N8F8_9MICO|nr:glycosyltransferase family A protein [Microbacterium nanhaiense]GGO66936.1 hypothetical protein GCM10010910_27540 [Microbacterium nanhaiense]
MLVFVTSMRHPRNATDYSYNEFLLRQTLESIALQTSSDYHVYVVGNREPDFSMGDKVTYVNVDFDPPAPVHGPHADRSGFVRDKGSKIGLGLIAAQEKNPDWVMIFDADDFVHRSIVSFVHDNPGSSGWVIRRGWVYSQARNGYRKQDGFNGTCGTSHILPYDAYAVPQGVSISSSQEEVLSAYGETLPAVLGAHRNAAAWFRERGVELRELPFRGAVYHVDTGENHSGKELRGVAKPWDRLLADEFGIPSSKKKAATIWRCIGPVALGQSLASLFTRALRRARQMFVRAN